MGLGLYIVKTMVQLHGGEIRAESVENEYTLFEFWIPNTGDKNEKKDKKTVKTIIKGNKTEKTGTIEVVAPVERVEGEPVDIIEAKEIVDVTDSVVEKMPETANKKREGKKGK